jgi:hypothetical protein
MSEKIQGLKMEVNIILKNKTTLHYLKKIVTEFEILELVGKKCFNSIEKNIKKNDKLLNSFSIKLKSLEFLKLQNNFNLLTAYFKNLEKNIDQLLEKTNRIGNNKSNPGNYHHLLKNPLETKQESPSLFKKFTPDFKNIDFSFSGIKNKAIEGAKSISSQFVKSFSIDGIKKKITDGIKKIPSQAKNFTEYFLPRKEKTPFLDQYTNSVTSLSLAIDSLGSDKISAIFKPLKQGNLIISNLKKIKGALKDITSVDGKFNLFKTLKFGALTAGLYLVSYLFQKFTSFITKNKDGQKAWQKVVDKTKKLISSIGKAFLEFVLILFGINSNDLQSGVILALDSIGNTLDKLEEKITKAREWIKENKELIREWGDAIKKLGEAALKTFLVLLELTNIIFKIFLGDKNDDSNTGEIADTEQLSELQQLASDINKNLDSLIVYLDKSREALKSFAEEYEDKKESFLSIVGVISAITATVALLTGNIWLAIGAFGVLFLVAAKSQAGNSKKITELRKNIPPTEWGWGYGLEKKEDYSFLDKYNIKNKATGTNYFPGGLTTINEKGDELILGPTGMVVANNPSTTNIMRDLATVKGSLSQIKFGMNGETGRVKSNNITINIGNISNRSDIDYLARQISMLDLS